MTPKGSSVRNLFGLKPSSPELSQYLASLADDISSPHATTADVKSYPDAVYLNYHMLGLSLLFTPVSGYKPKTGLQVSELDSEKLALNSLDIYNIPKPSATGPRLKGTSSRTAELAFSSFPRFPLALDIREGVEVKGDDDKAQKHPAELGVTPKTIGKEFVECLGEPDRKGGGSGPSSGSIGIWCEWTKDGIMVEFGGDEAKGPQAWERGKDAVWKNKTLSDGNSDEILHLQGVSWFKRKAISLATVTLKIKHYKDSEGVEHVDIDQTLTGGFPGTTEKRTLTWTERKHEDHLFGPVIGKTRRTKVDALEDDFLKRDWSDDTLEHGVIQSYVESDTEKSAISWIADQTWGIELIGEAKERRYTRHVKFTGPKGEAIECRLIYDYHGALDAQE
ncbi:hypothetical protein H0H92_003519 [Tricholoma furcatifolium]|nr:hypothetical protein H0H92_003519 [Tricholoma furcatifolium]